MHIYKGFNIKSFFYVGVCFVSLSLLSGCHSNGHYAGAKDTSRYADAMDSRANITRENAVEAMALYERLYARNRDDKQIVTKYAEALRKAGNAKQAEAILSPLVDLENGMDAAILIEYAAASIEMGQFLYAEHAVERVFALQSSNSKEYFPDAHHLRGVILSAAGKDKEAEEEYRKALETWKGDPSPVMNNLALCLAEQGDFDQAIKTLREALGVSTSPEMFEKNIQFVEALQGKVATTP